MQNLHFELFRLHFELCQPRCLRSIRYAIFCSDSISAMRADTAKFPWKTRKSNHCKWLSPPLIFPNPRKKPLQHYGSGHSLLSLLIPDDTRLFDLRIQFCVRISNYVVNYLGSCHIFNLGTCNMLLGYCGCNIL